MRRRLTGKQNKQLL